MEEQKEPEKVETLNQLLRQKSEDLLAERQMSETWISELEVTSRAYDQEKKKNKQLSQEVTLFSCIT